VISGPYTKGSVRMAKRRFSSRLASDDITTRGYRVLTFAKCTTVMTTVLTVTSGLESSRNWLVLSVVGFGLACVKSYDL
jgi:hypothetical protein